MAKTKRTLVVVTEVGTFTRTTTHDYAYLVAGHRPLTADWLPGTWACSWSTRLDLARAEAKKTLAMGFDDVRIFDVTTGLPVLSSSDTPTTDRPLPVVTIEKAWDGNECETQGSNGRTYVSRGRWQWLVIVDGVTDSAHDTRRAAKARVFVLSTSTTLVTCEHCHGPATKTADGLVAHSCPEGRQALQAYADALRACTGSVQVTVTDGGRVAVSPDKDGGR